MPREKINFKQCGKQIEELRSSLNARLEHLGGPYGHGISVDFHGIFPGVSNGIPRECQWRSMGIPMDLHGDAMPMRIAQTL